MEKLSLALAAATLVAAAPASAQTAYRWGQYNGFEEAKVTQVSPTPYEVFEPLEVAASNASSLARSADGSVWGWGNNQNGQLGDGELVDALMSPRRAQLPVAAVTIGEAKEESMAIDATGGAWVWGQNGSSSLCVRGQKLATPVKVSTMPPVVQVQGGQEHTVWLTSSGHVLVCGTNSNGQLGLGEGVAGVRAPTEVRGLSEIVEVSAGNLTTAARDARGRIYMWGNNEKGQIGIGSSVSTVWTPTPVPLPEAAKQVSAGGSLLKNGHTLAILSSGEVYGWGADNNGQVGDGERSESKHSPVATGLSYVRVAAAGGFSLGLDASGRLYSWGGNTGGALGIGTAGGVSPSPQLVLEGATSLSATAANAEAVAGR